MRTTAVTGALVAALGLLAGCGGSSTPSAAPATTSGPTVKIPLLAFDPTSLSVHKGDTVSWVNGNDINHVLVEGTYTLDDHGLRSKETDDGTFKLDVAKKGDVVKHTYDKTGTFTYYCTIHKGMNATVVVS